MSERMRKWTTCAVLVLLGTLAVAFNQTRTGVVRDEVLYMQTGSKYVSWWSKLFAGDGAASADVITAHWGGPRITDNNAEHPPLMKTLFGLSEKLFGSLLGKTNAYRLPNAVFFGLLLAMIFLWVRRCWGYTEAVVAALLAMLLPRAFFHAGLATFDAPVVTLWFAALYAYYRSLASPWKWGIGFGVFFGLLLATKHNAVILPAVIVPHWIWVIFRQFLEDEADDAGGLWRAFLARGPLTIPAMLIIGPLVLIALWPWLWFDTWSHASAWLGFHFDHVHYNFEYLGKNWNHPPFPWHVPLVTTLFTVPVVTIVAGAIGAGVLIGRARVGQTAEPERAPAILLLLSAAVAMGPFILTTTPIFGAEKHWAPSIPTLCIFAGIGVVASARMLADRLRQVGLVAVGWAQRACVVGLAALAIAAAAAETIDAQPYALSHYNALAGGAPGGADLGMNRQFWGYSARGVLDVLKQRAAAAGRPLPVYTHDASMSWPIYRRDGRLPGTLPDAGHEVAGIRRSQLALVVHELHFNRHDYLIWRDYGTVQPIYVLTTDGVPIVTVYARPSSSRSRPR